LQTKISVDFEAIKHAASSKKQLFSDLGIVGDIFMPDWKLTKVSHVDSLADKETL
jgi:hypothetical protein